MEHGNFCSFASAGAGADLGFGRIAPTAQKLGFHLRGLDAQMRQYDGVDHYCEAVGTKGKRHRFCVSQMLTEVDVWEESSDLVLPF